MIKLTNLHKIFHTPRGDVTVLSAINLQINPGEIFGVIGPSGAGKSTLIRCINLLERPTSGEVIIDGKNLTQLSQKSLREMRHKIGMIFQHFNLLSSRTAYENIALSLELTGMAKAAIHEKVMSLLELVELIDRKDFYPVQLSGGQKQRVAIARALANDPKVLLCDEATSALDPQTTHAILQLLKHINEKLGLTILLITHEMHVVKEICHRLAILEYGKIIEQAEVIQFFSLPESTIAKQFVRSMLKRHLPENLKKRILANPIDNSIPLLQISLFGKAAAEPLIAQLIQKFHFNLNILQANIETIRDQTVGIILIEADAEAQKIHDGMKYLIEKGIGVEVIGYVKRDN